MRATRGYRDDMRPGVRAARQKLTRISAATLVNGLAADPWAGVWRFDEFFQHVVALDPPIPLDAEKGGLTEQDVHAVRMTIQLAGLDASVKDVRAAIVQVANSNVYHPVREYLNSLRPSRGLLATLAVRALGADPEAQPLANLFLRKFLIAAAKRVLTPGAKVDTMLVLVGDQGARKSTFVNKLFSPWFLDQLPDISTRDGSHAIQGAWGVEVPECQKFLKHDKETVKDYLARDIDKYRQYGNGDRVVCPRQCVFIGTTNQTTILRDETGDRRTWPITVGKIDLAYLAKHRDAIWAEAWSLAKSGKKHWLTAEEEVKANEVRREYEDLGQWHDLVAKYLAGRTYVTSATAVYTALFGGHPQNRGQVIEVANTMRRLGCKLSVTRVGTRVERRHMVPEALQQTSEAATLGAKVRVLRKP